MNKLALESRRKHLQKRIDATKVHVFSLMLDAHIDEGMDDLFH